MVCLRRRLRLRAAVAGPRRGARGGAGAAAIRPLLLRRPTTTPTRRWRPPPPPRRQVRLRHPGHGSGRPRPIVRGTVIRVQVERVPARTRPPKVLWLWWAGPGGVDLDLAWRAYTRRFDCEHTIRFCKQ